MISLIHFLLDYSKGFGGKYGVENTTKDKTASNFEDPAEPVGTNYKPVKPDLKADIKGLKNRFENSVNEEARKRAEEIRNERLRKEQLEKDAEKLRAEKEPSPSFVVATNASPAAILQVQAKVVTTSPFRQQDSSNNSMNASSNPNEISSVSSEPIQQSKPQVGKIKINDQFLQSSSAPLPNQNKPAPFKSNNTFGSINKMGFQAVNGNNRAPVINSQEHNLVSNGSNGNYHENNTEQFQQQPEKNGVEAMSTIQSFTQLPEKQHPISSQPPPSSLVHTPPQFLRNNINNNNKLNEENEDEWGENPDPVKITPTYGLGVAPLATYDETEESFTSLTYQQQTNGETLEYQVERQVQVTTQHFTTTHENGHHSENHQEQQQTQNAESNGNGLIAVALYDYQAADEDEISFDPNDVITHIEQVENQNKYKQLI